MQTGVGAVLNTARVSEGATVLVAGAGGIGVSIVQGARVAGATKIIVSDPVDIHDLQATILNRLGVDHKRLTFKFQGRHFRLTDVSGEVVTRLLA